MNEDTNLSNIQITFEDKSTYFLPNYLITEDDLAEGIFKWANQKSLKLRSLETLRIAISSLMNKPDEKRKIAFTYLVNNPQFVKILNSLSKEEKIKELEKCGITSDNEFKDIYSMFIDKPFEYKGGQKIETEKPPKKDEEDK